MNQKNCRQREQSFIVEYPDIPNPLSVCEKNEIRFRQAEEQAGEYRGKDELEPLEAKNPAQNIDCGKILEAFLNDGRGDKKKAEMGINIQNNFFLENDVHNNSQQLFGNNSRKRRQNSNNGSAKKYIHHFLTISNWLKPIYNFKFASASSFLQLL